MNRNLWPGYASPKDCTPWVCPTCGQGTISIVEKSFQSAETAETKSFKHEDYFEYDWIRYVFTVRGQCSFAPCSEEFVISGKGRVEEHYVNSASYEDSFRSIFTPEYIYPMPRMILIPKDAPEGVLRELESTFSLFLQDPYASANRIRVALEELMDFVEIPNEKKSANGKSVPIGLHERIDLFKQKEPQIGNKVMALKWLGNSGSHLRLVEEREMKNDVLTALEIMEYCLEELIEGRSQAISKKASELEMKHKVNKPGNASRN